MKKAYKAAIKMLVHDSSSDDDDVSTYHDTTSSPRANVAVEEEPESDRSDSGNSLAAHAARMFSSLKE